MSAHVFLATLAGFVVPVQDTAPPGPDELVEQARAFIPKYEGDRKDFLTSEEQRHVQAATNILDAALALSPENKFALWWKGHCEVLLGEDLRNRGNTGDARGHYASALAAYDQAIALDPGYYWAHYARAMAKNNLGRLWDAIRDYDEAVRVASEHISVAAGDADLDLRFVRFKARQWRADTRMRVLEFERAREEFRSFYADNGNNRWDLGYSMAETYQRQRDFAGAIRTYEELLTIEDYATFDSTYAQLGYLAGLLRDRQEATHRLEEALEWELSPTLYPRMWLWILATDERHAAAFGELKDFLAHPPADLSAWDARLGGFVTGEGTAAEFLRDAGAEEERRKREAVALDDLPCEVWYYVGLRHEADAAKDSDDDARRSLQLEALDAYRRCVSYTPRAFKWEWEFARQRLAAVAALLGGTAASGFAVEGNRLVLNAGDERSAAVIESAFVHTVGEATSRSGVEALRERPLRPGDLVRCVTRTTDGTRAVSTLVVDVELP